jgi:hypothetical protein
MPQTGIGTKAKGPTQRETLASVTLQGAQKANAVARHYLEYLTTLQSASRS